MNEERNLRQCKVCKEIKLRILDGKYNDGRNKKWKDENGKLWNGNNCSDCHKEIQKEIQKIRRGK